MTEQIFLFQLEQAGFTLRAEGDLLIVGPFSKLTDEQKEFIRAHKAELLAELAVRAWLPGGTNYERIRSGWRLSRTEDGNYVWREPGTWEGAA